MKVELNKSQINTIIEALDDVKDRLNSYSGQCYYFDDDLSSAIADKNSEFMGYIENIVIKLKGAIK